MGKAGGMAEWSKAAVLKTVNRKVRGFESCSLRQNRKYPATNRGAVSKIVMPVKTGIQKIFLNLIPAYAGSGEGEIRRPTRGEMPERPNGFAC